MLTTCPGNAQRLDHEAEYLHALPSAEMYERSYMHRDVVTHAVVAAEVDFIATGSADGHVKLWKKRPQGVEFAKHFRAHLGPVEGAAAYPMRACMRPGRWPAQCAACLHAHTPVASRACMRSKRARWRKADSMPHGSVRLPMCRGARSHADA